MRYIKFRGKRVDNGQWLYGSLTQWTERTGIGYCSIASPDLDCYEFDIRESVFVEPATVGQFTGLLDKNGAEIYEGDKLLRYGSGFYTVEWSDNQCGFIKNNGNGGALSLNDCEKEVIGNIHTEEAE